MKKLLIGLALLFAASSPLVGMEEAASSPLMGGDECDNEVARLILDLAKNGHICPSPTRQYIGSRMGDTILIREGGSSTKPAIAVYSPIRNDDDLDWDI
jgi:hypothetical protein